MKIAFVAQGGFDRGGRERVVPALLWLVERLARHHEVHVFALRYGAAPSDYPLLGATVHDLGGRGPRGRSTWHLGRTLAKALRRVGPFDVVHAYMGAPPGALSVVAATGLRVPVLVTLDGGELVALPAIGYGLQIGWRSRLAVAMATRGADRLTVCTGSMRERLARHGRDADEVPLGVDTSLFTPDPQAPPGPPWRLLHVASLNAVKDQESLVRAFARVCRRVASVHLDVVGEDLREGHIQRFVAELGLEAAVTFHGFLPTEGVRDLCRRAHLLVQSSLHEAAGVSVLEAAACGVPAVGTKVGYVADGAGERAWAVPLGDVEGLAEGVVVLLTDDARRARLGAAARAWAVRYDADWTAAAFERIYLELATRKRLAGEPHSY